MVMGEFETEGSVAAATEGEGTVKPLKSLYSFFVYLLLGTSSVCLWMSFSNVLKAVSKITTIDKKSYTDTMTGVYFTLALAVTLICSKWSIGTRTYVYGGLSGLSVLALVFPTFLTLVKNPCILVVILHLYCGSIGFLASVTASASLGLAAVIPVVQIGAVALGMGLSGVLTSFVWLLSTTLLFGYERQHFGKAIWTLYLFCFSLILSTLICFICLNNSHKTATRSTDALSSEGTGCLENKKSLMVGNRKNSQLELPGENAGNKEYPASILKPSAETDNKNKYYQRKPVIINCFLRFCLFFQTMLVFPNISPLGWKDRQLIMDLSVAIFYIGDLIGRYSPLMTPKLLISENFIAILVMIRFAIITLIFLCMLYPENAFWKEEWLHLILIVVLAISYGFLSCVLTMRLPMHLDNPAVFGPATDLNLSQSGNTLRDPYTLLTGSAAETQSIQDPARRDMRALGLYSPTAQKTWSPRTPSQSAV